MERQRTMSLNLKKKCVSEVSLNEKGRLFSSTIEVVFSSKLTMSILK